MTPTKPQREMFKAIAQSLIDRNRPGSTGYRRSLGAVETTWEAEDLGQAFLNFVKRLFPRHEFRLSGVEGTGGTSNVRIRAYLAPQGARTA